MSGWLVVNVGTDSPVSHTESSLGVKPYDMVWDDKKKASRHAWNLMQEYAITRPELETKYRMWKVVEASPEQIERAKFVGAFGRDYADIIGAGQVSDIRSAPGVKIRDPETGDGDEIETFRDSLDG